MANDAYGLINIGPSTASGPTGSVDIVPTGLTAPRTYTIPDQDDKIVTETASQTLRNKTLVNPIFEGTVTLSIVEFTSPFEFGNVILDDTGLTANRTFTFPDTSGQLALVGVPQTFTNSATTGHAIVGRNPNVVQVWNATDDAAIQARGGLSVVNRDGTATRYIEGVTEAPFSGHFDGPGFLFGRTDIAAGGNFHIAFHESGQARIQRNGTAIPFMFAGWSTFSVSSASTFTGLATLTGGFAAGAASTITVSGATVFTVTRSTSNGNAFVVTNGTNRTLTISTEVSAAYGVPGFVGSVGFTGEARFGSAGAGTKTVIRFGDLTATDAGTISYVNPTNDVVFTGNAAAGSNRGFLFNAPNAPNTTFEVQTASATLFKATISGASDNVFQFGRDAAGWTSTGNSGQIRINLLGFSQWTFETTVNFKTAGQGTQLTILASNTAVTLTSSIAAGAVIGFTYTASNSPDTHTSWKSGAATRMTLSGAGRLVVASGIIEATADDFLCDNSARGLVLKDTQGTPHYWRVTVSTLGALVTADIGTTKP